MKALSLGALKGRLAGTLALAAGVATLDCGTAPAQTETTVLPDIYVTNTRLVGGTKGGRRGVAPGTAAPASTDVGGTPTEYNDASGIVTGTVITGASSTVITAQDIERSPGRTIQDILSREPGVQVTNLFGSVNGARSTVDMRGFGAAAASNTLILINGRRITDLDLAGVDLASIPRESIERIEITRGNSGAVLYGDGAVGGVINIVTKSGVGVPARARIDGGFGSFNYREGTASASGSNGPWAVSVVGNVVKSDGYRVNNEYSQANGVGDFRYTTDGASAYLNVSVDDQRLGLPGARRVEPSIGLNELLTDRRGARTPFDFSNKQGRNATAGFTRVIAPGYELIVDGGVRQKDEQAAFFGDFFNPSSGVPRAAVETTLTTWSLTPRVKVDSALNGMPWKATGGVDFYHAQYDSDRPLFLGAAPIHRYDLSQTTLGAYWQQTVTVLPSTDIGSGVRIQNHRIRARDAFDPNAPGAIPVQCDPIFGCFGDLAGIPLDKSETNYAYHLGIEHRLNRNLSVFGRHARSFRVPNVDERVGVVTSLNAEPTTFNLRTQISYDFEAGVRWRSGPVDAQWSVYDMYLTDEIHFRFGPNFVANNINLDPTRRYGSEMIAGYQVNDSLRFKGGLAYTRSVFREGLFAGNDVPLVSRWTGQVGVSWDVWQKYLTFDGVVRYVGARRMDNDQTNLQPLIPAHLIVDARVGGEYKNLVWSFAIQNLFDVKYFDYAIASPFPFGAGSQLNTYNAYPQPGRTFLARAGAKF
jgi:iron complex outermembrane receptor protein